MPEHFRHPNNNAKQQANRRDRQGAQQQAGNARAKEHGAEIPDDDLRSFTRALHNYYPNMYFDRLSYVQSTKAGLACVRIFSYCRVYSLSAASRQRVFLSLLAVETLAG
jgi:hypothetical protein